MTNLKQETIEKLNEYSKSTNDVLWCGSKEFGWFTWSDFSDIADFKYSSGFGGQKIPTDLLVVGQNFWLERHEYDDSEWWEFKELPTKPENYVKPKTLCNGDSWSTLSEMHQEGGKYGL